MQKNKRLFSADDLEDLRWGDEPEGFEIVEDPTIYDTGRWEVFYTMVFKYDGKFWRYNFPRGATECQDVDNDEDEYCEEVFPVKKTITVYE